MTEIDPDEFDPDGVEVYEPGQRPVREIKFSCCYCDEILDNDNMTGVCLYDAESGEGEQYWFAHESCFREKLHPRYNIDPEEEDAGE